MFLSNTIATFRLDVNLAFRSTDGKDISVFGKERNLPDIPRPLDSLIPVTPFADEKHDDEKTGEEEDDDDDEERNFHLLYQHHMQQLRRELELDGPLSRKLSPAAIECAALRPKTFLLLLQSLNQHQHLLLPTSNDFASSDAFDLLKTKTLASGIESVTSPTITAAPADVNKNDKVSVRCPACRKRIESQNHQQQAVKIVSYRNQEIHHACFQCCNCHHNLADSLLENANEIQQYTSNGRVRFQCASCYDSFQKDFLREHHFLPAHAPIKPNQAGTRVVIQDHEQGDIDKLNKEIGPELTEAAYFMLPKCSLCGQGFLSKSYFTSRGNWRYHQECWEQGNGYLMGTSASLDESTSSTSSNSNTIVLSPAASARYLPGQLILQLRNRSSANKRNGVLTTLYFVWKNKEQHSSQLREQHDNNEAVTISYALDERAPANPNYIGNRLDDCSEKSLQQNDQATRPKKRKTNKAVLTLPTAAFGGSDAADAAADMTLELLMGEEVAPTRPILLGSITVTASASPAAEEPATTMSLSSSSNNDSDNPAVFYLCGKLGFFKFGLQYTLTLQIPFMPDTSIESLAAKQDEDDGTLELDLMGSQLFVTIQD